MCVCLRCSACNLEDKLAELVPVLEQRGLSPQSMAQVTDRDLKAYGVKMGPILKMLKVINTMRPE